LLRELANFPASARGGAKQEPPDVFARLALQANSAMAYHTKRFRNQENGEKYDVHKTDA
jgi:hypothetical protein